MADFTAALGAETGEVDPRVPWLRGAGDLELSLALIRAEGEGEAGKATVLARRVPTGAEIDPAGTPVALELGGRGWRERRTIILQGESTTVLIETNGRPLAHARLDPDAAWTLPLDEDHVVLEGASLSSASPPVDTLVALGGTSLELHFDRALAPVTLDELVCSWPSPRGADEHLLVVRSAELRNDGRTLALETEAWMPERRYVVPLAGLRDRDGLSIRTSQYVLTVRPSDDTRSPRVVASVPKTASDVVAEGGKLALSITFDERMHRGQGITGRGVRDVERRGYVCPELDGFGVWDETGRSITYSVSGLEAGKSYALPIRAGGFRDLSQNECEDFDLIFTVTSVR